MFSESSPPLKLVEEDCIEPEDSLNIASNTDNQEETAKGDPGCKKSLSIDESSKLLCFEMYNIFCFLNLPSSRYAK